MESVSEDAARVCFAMGMCEQGSPDVYEKHLTMDITRSRVAVLVSQATLAVWSDGLVSARQAVSPYRVPPSAGRWHHRLQESRDSVCAALLVDQVPQGESIEYFSHGLEEPRGL